jgi:hypothetical protein
MFPAGPVDDTELGAHAACKRRVRPENDRIQPALTQRPQARIPDLRHVIAGSDRCVEAFGLIRVEPR